MTICGTRSTVTATALDWDLLRVFLGVMRTTNLREAANALGLSHPTIRRRLNALEGELGLKLFERRADGMHATPEAAELLDVAEQMETLAHTFDRRARGQSPDFKGRIEISAPDVLVSELLMPTFAALIDKWPALHLHVAPSEQLADLARREADVAVRVVPHGSSPDGDLTGRRAATIYTAVYGEEHQWIGYFGDERDQGAIRSERFKDVPVACSMANTYAVWAACLEGLGLAELPCFLVEPTLSRRTAPEPWGDIWVLVHPDLRRSPRLKVVRDELVGALKKLQPRLRGRA